MRTKVQSGFNELAPASKAMVLKRLKKGDQARVAEMVGTSPDYVKKTLRYRTTAKSALTRRIWMAAHRLLTDRERLQRELHA